MNGQTIRFTDFFNNLWIYNSDYNILTNDEKIDNNKLYYSYSKINNLTFLKNIDRELIISNINVLTIEITQSCNFRCKYCYLPKTNKTISYDLIARCIDFISEIYRSKRNLTVGFGTGEPLLEYNLIFKIVEKLRKKNINPKFTLTTNASQISHSILKFLDEHDFTLVISLDGPEDITDYNRNKKAYEYAMRAIDLIRSKFTNMNLIISCVLFGIKDLTEIKRINDFFSELEIDNLVVSFASIDDAINYIELICKTLIKNIAIGADIRNNIVEKNLISRKFQKIYDSFTNFVNYEVPYLRICFPGERVMIGLDGNLYLCEKTLHNFEIGCISKGFDLEKINLLVDEFLLSLDILGCKTCWAKHFCSRCFHSLGEHLHSYCTLEKIETLAILKLFTSLFYLSNYDINTFLMTLNSVLS